MREQFENTFLPSASFDVEGFLHSAVSFKGRMNLPVDGIKLHRGNFAAIGQQIQPLLDAGQCFRLQVKPWREKRSLSQNALSHMWYTEISEYLIKSGRTDATPEWVKRNLKRLISDVKR
jgi:hypothetical protein